MNLTFYNANHRAGCSYPDKPDGYAEEQIKKFMKKIRQGDEWEARPMDVGEGMSLNDDFRPFLKKAMKFDQENSNRWTKVYYCDCEKLSPADLKKGLP